VIDEGQHGLAGLRRVPLFQLRVTDGLWLMNKAALLQLEHFNKSNALSWALTMGLFATPVVFSDREFSQIVGESYYIQLGKDDRFGWTEPDGKVYQIAADNLVRLKDEISGCATCWAGGRPERGTRGTGPEQAADPSITQEVLRAYGRRQGSDEAGAARIAARQDEVLYVPGWTTSTSATSAASWTTPESCWNRGSDPRR
jgi:hypothetical protein